MELKLEEHEASASADELAAELAASRTTRVSGFVRRRPETRTTFPKHLPRERVVVDPPSACECCGSVRLRKLGEDVTRTLESIPRCWKVVETVREKFTCRDCERISQAPVPFHVIPRGWAGPSLLAMILYEKFGAHQPLNRLCERFALEGVPIPLSTAADAVGAACQVLQPVLSALERHVFSAERLHSDDTTVKVLAAGKTDIARCWVYVLDDRHFGGVGPPAAMFYYSRDRRGEHPERHLAGWAGVFQADAFSGYGRLYAPDRKPGPILEAACWAHARRPFFIFADLEEAARRKAQGKTPVAVQRPGGGSPDRSAVRDRAADHRPVRRTAPRGAPGLEPAAGAGSARLPAGEGARLLPRPRPLQGIQYLLKRWTAFTLFLEDGRVCLSNNAAERTLRGIALGRKSWLFCGSDRGGHRAAAMYSLIVTCKMNGVDPQVWLADVLARIAAHPAHRVDELLPWTWKALRETLPVRQIAA